MSPLAKFALIVSLWCWGIATARTANSAWEPPHLGEAAADGSLYLRLQLGDFGIGNERLSLEMQHRLRVELDGSCWSDWFLPQLQASLVSAGPGEMRLTLPGGIIALFRTELLRSRLFTPLSQAGLRGRRMDDGSVEIEAGGHYYRFCDGALVSIDYGVETMVRAESDGPRIKTLTDSSGLAAVRLDYDEYGRPDHGTVEGHTIRFCFEDKNGLLQRVEKDGRLLYSFQYAHQVLLRYRRGEESWETLGWAANPRHERGIRALQQNPLVISRVGNTVYTFGMQKSAAILLRELGNGQRDRMIIDYWRNIVLHDLLEPRVNNRLGKNE